MNTKRSVWKSYSYSYLIKFVVSGHELSNALLKSSSVAILDLALVQPKFHLGIQVRSVWKRNMLCFFISSYGLTRDFCLHLVDICLLSSDFINRSETLRLSAIETMASCIISTLVQYLGQVFDIVYYALKLSGAMEGMHFN
jgi:hypothetical protein